MTCSGLWTEPQYLVSILVSPLLWTLIHYVATKSSNLPQMRSFVQSWFLLVWTVSNHELHLHKRWGKVPKYKCRAGWSLEAETARPGITWIAQFDHKTLAQLPCYCFDLWGISWRRILFTVLYCSDHYGIVSRTWKRVFKTVRALRNASSTRMVSCRDINGWSPVTRSIAIKQAVFCMSARFLRFAGERRFPLEWP